MWTTEWNHFFFFFSNFSFGPKFEFTSVEGIIINIENLHTKKKTTEIKYKNYPKWIKEFLFARNMQTDHRSHNYYHIIFTKQLQSIFQFRYGMKSSSIPVLASFVQPILIDIDLIKYKIWFCIDRTNHIDEKRHKSVDRTKKKTQQRRKTKTRLKVFDIESIEWWKVIRQIGQFEISIDM